MTRLQVVDPHIHLWDLSTRLYPHFEKPAKGAVNAAICRSYLIEEYLEEGAGTVEVLGAVHVEAYPTDPTREVEALQRVADRAPIPIVMVSGGDLTSAAFPALLNRHQEFSIFRGVRQALNRNPDTAAPTAMDDPAFLEGLRELGRRGLGFDMQIRPDQMNAAAALAAKAPDTPIAINHAGLWGRRDIEGWRTWKQGLRRLAECPNVVIKISGLGAFDRGWTTESIRPLVFECIEAFGIGRAMFASNFPVDKLSSDFVRLWTAFADVVRGFSEDERAMLLRRNAATFYRFLNDAAAWGIEGVTDGRPAY